MSCEVWTTQGTYICNMTLRSKEELKRQIQNCEDTIKDCKARIKALTYMTEPKKFYSEDDPMFYMNKDLNEIFEEYDEARITLTRLWLFEEAWDKTHDKTTGKAILPVNPLDLKKIDEKIYMGGDYCEYVLEDGSELPDDWWDVYHGFVKPEDCTFREKLGYEPYVAEPERDMTVGEYNAMLKKALEGNNIEVNLDEL